MDERLVKQTLGIALTVMCRSYEYTLCHGELRLV